MCGKRRERRRGAACRGPCASIQPEVFVAATQTAKNPAMRYRESTPNADQTNANDGRKTNVLTRHDAARRNPPGKEEGQEKGIINIRGSEGCYARRQHRQISIHKGLYFPWLEPGEETSLESGSCSASCAS